MREFMRLLLQVSRAVLPVIFVLAIESTVDAQVRAGVGLVIAVDVGKSTLVLEAPNGLQRVLVAATATIRGERGKALALADLQPGDAVSYQAVSDVATRLHVARQFWALPSEW